MFALKKIAIFCLLVIGFSSNVFAETTLIITSGEFPPYVSKNPEDSFLTEILHEVAHEMGVTFVFKFMSWKRCVFEVEELTAWGAIPYVPTPEREKKFYFSDQLYTKQTKFFYYSPDGKKKNISCVALTDLKGYKIGGISGYYYKQMLLDAGLKVDFVKTEEQNFKKLRDGRVDLIPAVETLGWYMIKKLFPPEEIGNFLTLAKPLHVGGNYLMTSKQYPETQHLLTQFNLALKKVKENGVFQKILDKHGTVLTY